MKVSFVTLKGLSNFGSALQAYATYNYLKKIGYEVERIDYYPSYLFKDIPLLKRIVMKALLFFKIKKFNKFIATHTKLTEKTYRNCNDIKKDNLQYDAYIVGSDQVWNSDISNGKLDPTFFLEFTESNNKIAFSSSIGKTDVSKRDLNLMKEYLKNFSAISVREESAKKLLEEVGVFNIENVLDPVFLLEKEDYRKLIKKPKYDNYLLIYTFEKNNLTETLSKKIAKKLGLKIVEIGIYRSKYQNDVYIHNAGVEEFLSLIYYSEFFITSSFHGTALSILLNKQFVSVAPSFRKTRLENITNKFDLTDRLISKNTNYNLAKILLPIDYEAVNQKIEIESDKSRLFLSKALEDIQ